MSKRKIMLTTNALLALASLPVLPPDYVKPYRPKSAPPQHPTTKRAKVKAARKQKGRKNG